MESVTRNIYRVWVEADEASYESDSNDTSRVAMDPTSSKFAAIQANAIGMAIIGNVKAVTAHGADARYAIGCGYPHLSMVVANDGLDIVCA